MTRNNPLLKDQDATVRIAATPDQTWAFDADYLYQRLEMLRPVGRHYVRQIQFLDLLSDILLVAGVLSAFFVAWWTVFPLVGVACAQRYSNRRRAGELAARAAQESTDIFLYLYNSGVLSVEQTAPNRRRA
ncbi:hypothetical protein RYZ27_14820 [Hyphomonas sp. FCG-A18]|jgi:hypothetical protein|uniref:hypothetical protein n=1 Tax=Hyphomonas sp. FCG-A18 TaxID=3080019 RepID=UPI002B2CAA8D|nr:hypothetical protein RYZ27_14820 [Hyphomonas sp. FCG-A18]